MTRVFDKAAKGLCSFNSVGPVGAAIVNGAMALFVACSLSACGRGISLDPSVSEPQLHSDGSRGLDAADGSSTEVERGDADASVTTADRKDAPIETNEGVSDAVDETGDALPDGTVEADDGCATACGEPAADYYVAANASPRGDGSSLRPFRTITAAIDAYSGSQGEPKTVRVAAGTYDEALGEHFPLVLRGLSMMGAGQDKTFIVGSGDLDHAEEGGAVNGQYSVTLVVGDQVLTTRISNVSVRPIAPIPAQNYHGIFCDRGSATGAVVAPAGLTVLDKITAGPGYHFTVLATTSTSPSPTGCNLQMTGSTLTGGWMGLYAVGCGGGIAVPVVLDIGGSDPANGNTFSWMQLPNAGEGVLVQSCVTRGSFQFNSFTDDVIGFALDQRDGPPASQHPFTIKNNTFERISVGGLLLLGSQAFVEELTDNTFTQVTRSLAKDNGPPSQAIASDILALGKVRRNRFIGNDIGVLFAFVDTPGPPPDLGTPEDPGNNVFRCNSGLTGSGADLWIGGFSPTPETSWAGTIPLAGNSWDHVPPTVQPSDTFADGSDVALTSAPNVTIDLGNATLADSACPSNRVPGP